MNTMTAWLDDNFQEVEPKEFYRGIFPAGQLDTEGAFTKGKYTGIIVAVTKDKTAYGRRKTLRYSLTDDLAAVDVVTASDDFCICAPLSYAGKKRTAENARMLYAIAVDVDKLIYGDDGNPVGLRSLWKQITGPAHFLPKPTYIVSSGTGLHLYYVLQDPVPLFDNIAHEMQELKRALTTKIWNGFVVEIKSQTEIQQEGIYQGFRMPGTVTKHGERARAFITGSKVTIEYLNGFVEEMNRAKKAERVKKRGKVSRAEAAQKWPEWYDRRVVKGQPRGSWHTSRALYDWWKGQIMTGATVGHRYYCVMMLAVYAKKCGMYDAKHNPNPVTEEELQQDAYGLVQILDSITTEEKNHFGADDVQAALQAFHERWITYPREAIADKTGIQIKANKRNGNTQAQHLEQARAVRDIRFRRRGEEWDKHNGRKSVAEVVQKWQRENPEGTKAACIRATGLQRHSVSRYWNGGYGDIVGKWQQKNPEGTKAACIRATGLAKHTVYKYWQSSTEPAQPVIEVQPAAAAPGDGIQARAAADDGKRSLKEIERSIKKHQREMERSIQAMVQSMEVFKSTLDAMTEGPEKEKIRKDYEAIKAAYDVIMGLND